MSNINPFSKEYFGKELISFTYTEKALGNVKIKNKKITNIEKGYFHKYIFNRKIDTHIPHLYIDGLCIVSFLPSEIESHYMPIALATGKVGVAGIGLGYYLQRILEKDEVNEVIAYDINKYIIELYLKNFGEHPKLKIINNDIRKINGESFEFFYNDIYDQNVNQFVIDDMHLLLKNNEIKAYHFWTIERLILELQYLNYKIPEWGKVYLPFLEQAKSMNDNIIYNRSGNYFYYKLKKYNLL